jgi:hypothetical protein
MSSTQLPTGAANKRHDRQRMGRRPSWAIGSLPAGSPCVVADPGGQLPHHLVHAAQE